jgi:hypothetical protein
VSYRWDSETGDTEGAEFPEKGGEEKERQKREMGKIM